MNRYGKAVLTTAEL